MAGLCYKLLLNAFVLSSYFDTLETALLIYVASAADGEETVIGFMHLFVCLFVGLILGKQF